MLFIKKKYTLDNTPILQCFTDFHCHLLPGVDDGVKTMDETLQLLDAYRAQGVSEVWLTPHVMEDVPNRPSSLKERFDELKATYDGPINLHLASEHMLDNLFDDRLEKGEILPIGANKDMLLVETSYFTPPVDLDEKLENIKKAGLYPLLAHPERYVYMGNAEYKDLINNNVRLQLNLFSLLGMYGPTARAKAQYLLNNGAYYVIGTDTHSAKQWHYAMATKILNKKEISALLSIIEKNKN